LQNKVLFKVKALFKLIDTSARVDKLLFAGKKRVAFGAYVNLDVFLAGEGFVFLAASASDDCFFIYRMNSCLHFIFLAFSRKIHLQ